MTDSGVGAGRLVLVVVTGSLGPEDRERLVGSGLSAVLTKPVEPAQLVAAVAAAAGA